MKKILLTTIFILAFYFLFLPKTAEAGIIFKPVFHTGLVGYWDFQEGTGDKAYDKSGYDNDGTLENMATSSNGGWTDGKLGSALNFDGIDDSVLVSDDPSLRITSDLTISVWMKANSYGQYETFVNSSGHYILRQDFHGDDLQFLWWDGADVRENNYDGNHVLPSLDAWHHLVGVVSNNDISEIYIDGVAQGVTPQTSYSASRSNDYLYIGNKDGPQCPFDGKIDEVRIYDRALSAGEVERLYKLSQPTVMAPTETGLVGYWRFDEGTGTKAGDHSGQGNNGDLTNMEESDWVNGKLGTALDFDGSDEYVDLGSDSSLDFAQPSTITAWIKIESLSEEGTVYISRKTTEGDSGYQYRIQTDGTQRILRANITNIANSDTGMSTGLWYHIGVTYDTDGSYVFYLDGASDGSGTNDDTFTHGTHLIGWNGGQGGENRFNGVIDEVRIYNRVLETSEIEALYKSGLAKINTSQNDKITNGLVGLWSFNGPDMDGNEAWDRSGQGNHGTLQNGPIPTSGKVGQALEFDGSDDHIDIGDIVTLEGLSQISVAAWVCPDDNPGGHEAVASKELIWKINIESGGTVRFLTGEDWVGSILETANTITTDGSTWSHIICTYDGSTKKCYINGSQDSNTTSTSGGLGTGDNKVTIGAYETTNWWDEHFDGKIDEVRVYNRALTAKEIQRLYNLGR